MSDNNPPATRTTRSTRQILKGSNHILHSLYAQSRILASVESAVARYISDEFAVSSFKNNELTIICPSGATATKLRYRQRNIISSLRRGGMDVKSIRIRVQPITRAEPRPEVHRTLSDRSASQLRSTADHIPEGPLRDALLKLSRRNADQSR